MKQPPSLSRGNDIAKILVDGAGPLGSLFAARLQQGSNHVSILARGQRLDELREYGSVLVDVLTQEQTVTRFVIDIIIVQRESVTER